MYSVSIAMATRLQLNGQTASMSKISSAYRMLILKPSSEMSMRKWKENIKTDLREIGCEVTNSGTCPIADFCSGTVYHSGSATKELYL